MVKQKQSDRASQNILVNNSPTVNGTAHKQTNGGSTHKKEANMEVDGMDLVNGVDSPKTTPSNKKDQKLTLRQRVEKAEKLASPAQTSGDGGAESVAVLLTQGIMANDSKKVDIVLRESRIEVLQATLTDLQVMHVIPLLKALEHRLRTRQAVEIRPWIRWVQCIFSMHMSYLISQRNLDQELGGLLEWMRARVGHHQKLLALQGKLSLLADQIERRTNLSTHAAPKPLIVFNNDDNFDSDMDDLESLGSDESGASSEEDWWDDGQKELGVDEDDDEEEDDSELSEDDGPPEKNREEEDDDGSGMGSGDDDDDEEDDDEEDEMDVA